MLKVVKAQPTSVYVSKPQGKEWKYCEGYVSCMKEKCGDADSSILKTTGGQRVEQLKSLNYATSYLVMQISIK